MIKWHHIWQTFCLARTRTEWIVLQSFLQISFISNVQFNFGFVCLVWFDAGKFCYQICLFLGLAMLFSTWLSSVSCSCILASQGLIADTVPIHIVPVYDPGGEYIVSFMDEIENNCSWASVCISQHRSLPVLAGLCIVILIDSHQALNLTQHHKALVCFPTSKWTRKHNLYK